VASIETFVVDGIAHFLGGLWGNPEKIARAMVRECYKTTITEILKLEHYRYLIGGAKGIGKSVLGVLLVRELLDANNVVVYQWESKKFLLVGKHSKAEARLVVSQALKHHEYANLDGHGVFDLALHPGIFSTLTNASNIIHLIDFDNDALISTETAPTGGGAHRIVISSPNDARLKKYCEEHHTPIYLPPWSEEEILEMLETLNGPLEASKVEAIKEKYGWVGGST
jgi:hypothetical protein